MAYETGSSTGGEDLIGKINNFAVANGWTSHRNTSTDVCISHGDLYQNINWSGNINMKAATGFDSGAAYNVQPGQALETQVALAMAGSFVAYHLFTNATGDYIHIVVEVNPNWFRHLAFGILNKGSSYTGGEYSAAVHQVSGVAWTNTDCLALFSQATLSTGSEDYRVGSIRGVFDGISNPWMAMNNYNHHSSRLCIGTDNNNTTGSGANSAYKEWNNFYRDWRIFSPSVTNALNSFAPIHFFADRTDDLWSPMGSVFDIRTCTMRSFKPNDEITIDSDTWIVFPGSAKSNSWSADTSYYIGYAYRKIV